MNPIATATSPATSFSAPGTGRRRRFGPGALAPGDFDFGSAAGFSSAAASGFGPASGIGPVSGFGSGGVSGAGTSALMGRALLTGPTLSVRGGGLVAYVAT